MGDWNTERLVCRPDWNDGFANAWQGIEQVVRLERTVRILTTGEIHHEVGSGISRLSFHQGPAPGILALVRDHWAIEKRLPWLSSVTDGEKMPVKHVPALLPVSLLSSTARS